MPKRSQEKYGQIFFIMLGLSLLGSSGYLVTALINGLRPKALLIIYLSIIVAFVFTRIIESIDESY